MLENIISSIEGEDSEFIQYEYATYRAVFDDVKIFMVNNNDRNDKQNLIGEELVTDEDLKQDSKYSQSKGF